MVNKIKEDFAKFAETPDRVKFREFLKQNTGEYPFVDFKETWLDDPKLAKHILAMSNSGGGVLVIGMGENPDKSLNYVGITSLEDKTNIDKKLQKYLPNDLKYDILDFEYDNNAEWGPIKNKKFQILIVADIPESIPFLSMKGHDKILYKNRVYCRSNTSTEEATHEELQKIIKRRLDTVVGTTNIEKYKEHLVQLNLLFDFLNTYERNQSWMPLVGRLPFVQGPNYPKEDYRTFLIRMIKIKTGIIEKLTISE